MAGRSRVLVLMLWYSDSGFGVHCCLFSGGCGCHGAVYPSNNISPFSASLFFFLSLSLSSDGLAAFRAFLRTEFSEENLDFWLACEDYKKIKSQSKMASKAKKIFAEFIAIQSCKEVRLEFGIILVTFILCKNSAFF